MKLLKAEAQRLKWLKSFGCKRLALPHSARQFVCVFACCSFFSFSFLDFKLMTSFVASHFFFFLLVLGYSMVCYRKHSTRRSVPTISDIIYMYVAPLCQARLSRWLFTSHFFSLVLPPPHPILLFLPNQ